MNRLLWIESRPGTNPGSGEVARFPRHRPSGGLITGQFVSQTCGINRTPREDSP